MKCRVCRKPAYIKLPAHNAAFCPEHFDAFFLRQVSRTIKKYRMLPPGARVVVALSGGKDSLVTALTLQRLGYEVLGFFIDLGIGEEFSLSSRRAVENFCQQHQIPLHIYSVQERLGRSLPQVTRKQDRICALCGVTKRHLMNEYALATDAYALATGHTLDDMAAALLANLMRWDLHYLARGLPVLPPEPGFARKIKPLALQGEKEIRAFADLHGIDPTTARCPYASQAKFKRFKAALEALEEQSPGLKRSFYEGYTQQAHRFVEASARPPKVRCLLCGFPSASPICTFCRTWRKEAAEKLEPKAKP
ncbi:ATP-binding protein [Desulfothermobacter acidiphilus]|uniref:ATP-binding protein n=1 Tax=Desulfothermobacter acidiphilus TaxID=1938353 RepID=UPI003F8A2BF4